MKRRRGSRTRPAIACRSPAGRTRASTATTPAPAGEKGEPTPIPPSHYVDLRHAPEKKGAKRVGARCVCIACHVATTDAGPRVGNTARR